MLNKCIKLYCNFNVCFRSETMVSTTFQLGQDSILHVCFVHYKFVQQKAAGQMFSSRNSSSMAVGVRGAVTAAVPQTLTSFVTGGLK